MSKPKQARPRAVAAAAPPRRRKRSDLMVEEIKRWLAVRQVKPGDRLPQEAQLQELFGLSKGSTREALKSLEVQGLVTLKSGPDGGATVTEVPFSRTFLFVQNHLFFQGIDVATIYGVRRLLEPELAASASVQVDAETLRRLEESIEFCAPAPLGIEQSSRQHAEDLHFHDIIAEAAPNRLLRFNCRCINELLRYMIVFKVGTDATQKVVQRLRRDNLKAHQGILAAMRKRDPERVRKLMLAHVVAAEDLAKRASAVLERRFLVDSDLEVPILFPGVRRAAK